MRALAILALLLSASSALAGTEPRLQCPPTDAADEVGPLDHLRPELKPGGILNILAVGSAIANPPAAGSKTAGAVPSPTGFPAQFARMMESAVAGIRANLTVLAQRGQTADAMLAPMQAELARRHYALVLWQTGTVEAVLGVPPDEFYETLAKGAAASSAAGAELVLIDPQYSHFLEANANLAPYLSAMQSAGALPGVVLFHRFDMMRDWADDGGLDLEHSPKAQRSALAARLHACLAQALARMLLAAQE